MKIVLLQQALLDLEWFHQYYKSMFPEGVRKAKKQFSSVRQMLESNPFIGHLSTDVEHVRELHIARTPFTIVYRVTDTHIEVLRVWDTRQGDGG